MKRCDDEHGAPQVLDDDADGMRPRPLDAHGLVRPLLRGWFHAAAGLLAIPAGVVLVMRSSGVSGRVAAAVYAATLVMLFATSSLYHRWGSAGRARIWLRRLDHSSIFLLIAGSYTPVCVLVLSGWRGAVLLATVWAAALTGVVLKLARFDSSHRIGFALYLIIGWAAILAMPSLVGALSARSLLLLVVGGAVYTVGAIILATRFPNPFPRVFGYHEVWHVLVVVAAALHYVAITDVLTAAH